MKFKQHNWPHNKTVLQQCYHCGMIKRSERTIATRTGFQTIYEKLDGTKSKGAGECDDKLLYAMNPGLARLLQINFNQKNQSPKP